MVDYASEQEMELEALRAILMDDFQDSEDVPAGWPTETLCYRIPIRIDKEDGAGQTEKRMDFVFAHTANYPDEAPLAKLSSLQGLTASEVDEVNALIEEQIQTSLGMAMVYTIISSLKEWLADQVAGVQETGFEVDAHEEQKRQQQAVEERLAELRAHGTPVSATTFQAWREKFQSEKHQLHSARLEPASKDKGPTGKAFFLAQELAGVQTEDNADEASSDSEDFELGSEDEEDDEEDLIEQFVAQKHITGDGSMDV